MDMEEAGQGEEKDKQLSNLRNKTHAGQDLTELCR